MQNNFFELKIEGIIIKNKHRMQILKDCQKKRKQIITNLLLLQLT